MTVYVSSGKVEELTETEDDPPMHIVEAVMLKLLTSGAGVTVIVVAGDVAVGVVMQE